jgi:hypothetical protein
LVILKANSFHFLTELSYCYHGNHQEQKHRFPKIHIIPKVTVHDQLYVVFFPSKRSESWAHVILLLGFGFGFDHNETTEPRSDLNWSLQK